MTNKVLGTCATCTGTTVGVAEAISRTLSEDGALVDVMSMREVRDLSAYRSVVAGSAIQDKKWLPERLQFVKALRRNSSTNHSPLSWCA